MTHPEIPLPGGQINAVVRVGDTVRRTPERDMSVQHALLRHLEAAGFTAAPRFLGHDEAGREILSFMPGEVPYERDDFSDAELASAARLLRAYHDATSDFPPVLAAGAEVMCHNDWTPANTTCLDGLPTGMIDFDTAEPGTRLWDVAYSAWMWLGLAEPVWSPDDQRRRLAVFVAAYDHPSVTPLWWPPSFPPARPVASASPGCAAWTPPSPGPRTPSPGRSSTSQGSITPMASSERIPLPRAWPVPARRRPC